MRVTYDDSVDVLRIALQPSLIEYSSKDTNFPDLILDYDEENRIVGFEMLHASQYILPNSYVLLQRPESPYLIETAEESTYL